MPANSDNNVSNPDPQDMVLTPGGYRPRSMVHEIGTDNKLRITKKGIQAINAKTKAKQQLPVVSDESMKAAFSNNNWVTYAYWYVENGNLLQSFEATWIVPPAPVNASGQTIFLFNGIQNVGSGYGILQPVLQWGASAIGGGPFWSVASWYVQSDQQAIHTPFVQVNPGDRLTGVMKLVKEAGGLYNYTCEFKGIPQTRRTVEKILPLIWCNHALEAYNTSDCNDFPPIDKTTFGTIVMKTKTGTIPLWTPVDNIVQCGQHCDIPNNGSHNASIDLFYR